MAKISETDEDLKELILKTTEKLLRRYGARKLSVVDIAREIGMSHGNVYRFFDSKSVLLAVIAERWLCNISSPLAVITESDMPADKKLFEWLETLRTLKRKRYADDPEVFSLYGEIAEQAGDIVKDHVSHLVDMIEMIVKEGKKAGVFKVADTRLAAASVLNATFRLHHPLLVAAPNYPSDDEARYLINMVINSLKYDQ